MISKEDLKMPAVSKKQQRYFGYLLSNPEERKKKGISKKAAKDFAQDIQEVSPPGWGHTKAEKEKTKPWKPKSKIGGTAAAFKRALDDGRFKGLPGSKTKKEKTADMFKLMWSMKKKGDKPHYKPGTDKKYKKYQKEDTAMQDNNLFGDAYASLKKKIGSKKKHNKPAVEEGSLHKWFKGSKSKDGKKGWVNVVTGGTCASDKPGEGTPKCVSSSKRASMTKAERLSASRRKKKADPNQQSKSGAAKPTYVRTDEKKKMKESLSWQQFSEKCWDGYTQKGMKKKGKKVVPNCVKEEDKKGKGSGTKDACYHKVKASAKVWPSAYASGRLVQCRKKGAANYGNKSEGFSSWRDELGEGAAWTKKAGKNKEGGLNEKGRKSYERENPGSDLKAPQPEGGSRKKSFCARMGGMKKKLTSAKTANDPDSRINKALRKWKC